MILLFNHFKALLHDLRCQVPLLPMLPLTLVSTLALRKLQSRLGVLLLIKNQTSLNTVLIYPQSLTLSFSVLAALKEEYINYSIFYIDLYS